MKMSGGKSRLLYVLEILKKYSDEEHPLSSSEIIVKLDEYDITADRKALYDDVSVLCSFGYDIIHTRTPKSGYFLAERELEFTELSLLADAVLSADFITAKKTAELTKKLSGFLSENQARTFSGRIFTEKRAKSDNEELYYTVDKLLRAIENKKKVELTYNKRILENGKPKLTSKQHIISPYALSWVDDHYYLIGNNEKYDNLLHLRIDRINKVNILKDDYRHFSQVCAYKDYFDVADYT
ncbi:MAG: WYL domain-containing protein, partial [Oscillospiraceae bacterium]|nr:WYL domain-containing protein [Candidatus Equicaccousia limihippi]